MIRRDEAAAYAAELAVTGAYAAVLHRLNRRYEPDWTWLTVMIGVVISTVPARHLARITPTSWRDYERRVLVGFLVSGAVIIPWQLWLATLRAGRKQGYALAARTSSPQEYTDADPAAPLEPSA